MQKKSFFIGFALGLLIMIGAVVGYNAYERHFIWGGEPSPNEKVREMYSIVTRNAAVEFDWAEMIDNMYRGFLAGIGDPYTQYLNEEALEAFQVRTEGVFVGIGVRVYMDLNDDTLTLATVFSGSPAAEAGLMPGDKIIAVDGVGVVGRIQQEILSKITGEAGTVVNLEIYRPYENIHFDVNITRRQITVPTVFHEMIETDEGLTGYVRIVSFERPTYSQFVDAIEELLSQGMDSLIVDVRNNPGGLLNVVSDITNMLIPEGVIVSLEYGSGERYVREANNSYLGLPLVVLINGRSASASEVLSGAVRDTGVGILVGEQTFGKGIVQTIFNLSGGAGMKLTTALYFTPSGAFIHDVGIEPDFLVEMEESRSRRIGDLPFEEDIQLQVALRALRQR